MIRPTPMTRLLAKRTFWLVLGLFALIEAIYLAESFSTLIRGVIRYGGSAWDVALLLLLKTPEVVDFALPLVLLLAIYFAISGARETNELIVCAAAGVPWTSVPVFAGVVGVLGLVTSLLFTGMIAPTAAYTTRLALHGMEARSIIAAIEAPGPLNEVRTINQRTLIASPSDDPEAKRGNLFVFHPDRGEGWRVNQATDWQVIGPDDKDGYILRMESFREYRGRSDQNPVPEEMRDPSLRDRMQQTRITFNTLQMAFQLDQVLRSFDDARRTREKLLPQLGRDLVTSESTRPGRKFGEMIASALLCPFAALVAVAAAALATMRSGRFLALPVGVLTLLGADIVARAVLGDAATIGLTTFGIATVVLTSGGLLLPLAVVVWRSELIIAPDRGRA